LIGYNLTCIIGGLSRWTELTVPAKYAVIQGRANIRLRPLSIATNSILFKSAKHYNSRDMDRFNIFYCMRNVFIVKCFRLGSISSLSRR